MSNDYWDYKNLITVCLYLSMPFFAMYFESPTNVTHAFKPWIKWIIPLFGAIMIWSLPSGSYHFLLSPLFLFSLFLITLPKKWKIFIVIIFLLMFTDLGARAQVIKVVFSILLAISFYFRRFIPTNFYKVVFFFCFAVPVFFLSLGISGTFNIFEDLHSKNEGKFLETKTNSSGYQVYDDVSADTRTFIYVEVIQSAINNNYILWGRTPARGNDSEFFGQIFADLTKDSNRHERLKNEVCHPNVFTWLGLIGLLLHCLIYFNAARLAIFNSNNTYVKFIGTAIAFNWALGWIENTTGFNIMNLTIWLMIGMGLSAQFREMNDDQFKLWFVNLFKKG